MISISLQSNVVSKFLRSFSARIYERFGNHLPKNVRPLKVDSKFPADRVGRRSTGRLTTVSKSSAVSAASGQPSLHTRLAVVKENDKGNTDSAPKDTPAEHVDRLNS